MDEIQRQLEEYLEEKRGKFPRFYFLSNDELLQILAVSTDMMKVEKHLMKVFQAIHSLQFSDSKQILAMISPEGEKVKFKNSIRTKGNSDSKIEDTLQEIENGMIDTMKIKCKEGLEEFGADEKFKRTQWVTQHPGQVIAAISHVIWTEEVEDTIQSDTPGAMEEYLTMLVDNLSKLTEMIR